MNKKEFMRRLKSGIAVLPQSERQDIMRYYDDYFSDAGTENEEKVLSELGSPEDIAATLVNERMNAEHEPSVNDSTVHALPPFKRISIDLHDASVEILRGNEFSVTIQCANQDDSIEYEIHGDTLKIEEEVHRHFVRLFSWSFEKRHVRIVVGTDILDKIEVENVNGAVSVTGLSVRKAVIENVNGGIKLNGMVIENVQLECVNGGINCTNIVAKDSHIENVNGGVRYSGRLDGKTEVECVNGSTTVETTYPENECSLKLTNLFGGVSVNGKKLGKNLTVRVDSARLISVESVNGPINVKTGCVSE